MIEFQFLKSFFSHSVFLEPRSTKEMAYVTRTRAEYCRYQLLVQNKEYGKVRQGKVMSLSNKRMAASEYLVLNPHGKKMERCSLLRPTHSSSPKARTNTTDGWITVLLKFKLITTLEAIRAIIWRHKWGNYLNKAKKKRISSHN